MDIFVSQDPGDSMIAIVEIKDSDWDRMVPDALRRNINRQIRQLWSYVHSLLDSDRDVCPGIIFRRRPVRRGRLELIERVFNENGIQVVWDDETTDERRRRP